MAATYNLGSAVATIVVTSDTKGVSDASNAVEDFGKKGERTSRVLDIALGNVIATAAVKAFDAVTNLAGAVWDLGMNRAVAIENAQAKLKGLGYSAEDVQSVMDSALAAVKGTIYGLGDAAGLAAVAVAAGIKPGQELENQLKLTANAASAMGVPLQDVGNIMQNVWTRGSVSMDEINQIMSRGIPILGDLAKSYGVSTDEMRAMISNGEVDLAKFSEVMSSSVGSVADEMGGTFEGMSANAQAALGRLGEKAAGALLPYLSEALQLVIELADGFGQKFGPIIEQVATQIGSNLVDAIKTGIDMMTNLGNFINDNSTWLGPLAVAVGAVAAAMIVWETAIKAWTIAQTAAKLIQDAFNASMLANPIGAVIAAIVALVAGLVWFFTQTELGREVWANFTRFVGEAWNNTVQFVTETLKNLGNFFTTVWVSIVSFVVDLVTGFANFFVTTFTGVSNFFTDLWNGVRATFEAVWWAIQTYVQTIIGIIIGIFTGDFSKVPGVVRGIWDNVMRFTQDAWNNILNWLGSVPGWILDVFNGAGKWLFNIGKDILNGLWNGLEDVWNGLVGWIADIGNSIADTFAGVLGIHSPSRVFMGFGEDIMQGLMNGIDSMKTDAIGQMGGLSASLSTNVDQTIKALPSANSAAASADAPLTVAALFSDENIDRLADRLASSTAGALLEIRTLDGRSAALATKQGVR